MKKLSVFFLAFAPMSAASAETVEQMFQRAVNREGNECSQVTVVEGIAKTKAGDSVVAAACADGSTHALILKGDNSIEYLSSCEILLATSGLRCFD